MTTALARTPSPTQGQAARSGGLRTHTYASLPAGPAGEGAATYSNPLLEEAKRRTAKREAAVRLLLASGACKEAFNQALGTLQMQLAHEYRRRPHEMPAVYACLAEQILAWAREAPELWVEETGDAA